MKPEDLNAVREKLLDVAREVGAIIDATGMAAELLRLPGDDPAADAMLVHTHLDDAANAADAMIEHGNELLRKLDLLTQQADKAAGAFLVPEPAAAGGES